MSDAHDHSALHGIADKVRRWLKLRAEERELQALPDHVLQEIARDVGLSVSELTSLKVENPGASTLMPQRLEAMGIDAEYVRNSEPAVYRDLERVCGRCKSWAQCEQDMAHGDVESGQCSYCGNAATIDALAVEQRRDASKVGKI